MIKWIRVSALRLLGVVLTLSVGHPLHGQVVRKIDLQQYERFWRLAIFTEHKPVYTIDADAPHGRLQVDLAGEAADSLVLPRLGEAEIEQHSTPTGLRYTLQVPFVFRYEHFFFSHGGKIIIDLYPDSTRTLLAAAPQKAPPPLSAARDALAAGDTVRAMAHFAAAITSGDSIAEASFQLGLLHYSRNELDSAKMAFHQAMQHGIPPSKVVVYLDSIVLKQSVDNLDGEKHLREPEPEPARLSPNPKPIIVARKPPVLPWLQRVIDRMKAANLSVPLAVIVFASFIGVYLAKKTFRRRSGARPKRARCRSGRRLPAEPDTSLFRHILDCVRSQRAARCRAGTTSAPEQEERDFRAVLRGYKARGVDDDTVRDPEGTAMNPRLPRSHASFFPEAERWVPVKEMALNGFSVQEIARTLNMGVREVEMVLNFDELR